MDSFHAQTLNHPLNGPLQDGSHILQIQIAKLTFLFTNNSKSCILPYFLPHDPEPAI